MAHSALPEEAHAASQREISPTERWAWFHWLFGPVGYSVYFIVGYLIAEAGCKTTFLDGSLLGLDAVSVVILALTAVTALALLGAAGFSFRRWQQYRGVESRNVRDAPSEVYQPFIWLSGALLDGLFLLLTLVTGLSVLALEPCVWM